TDCTGASRLRPRLKFTWTGCSLDARCGSESRGPYALHRDGRFDGRMRIVPNELKIFVLKIVDVLHLRIQLHRRERPRFASKLQPRLFEVIAVKMQIAKCMHERSGS